MTMDPRIADLLDREAVFLDDRRWDDWLALFATDCEYWAPTWKDEDELTTDPRTQLSHVYYASRQGLEDRIVRIRSGRSPASSPMRRTCHIVGPVTAEQPSRADALGARSSWVCHVFDPRHKESLVLFGAAHYEFVEHDRQLTIQRKRVVVHNDFFPAVVDVYCL